MTRTLAETSPPDATRHDLDLENIEDTMNHVRICIRGVRLAISVGDAELVREIGGQIQSLFESACGMTGSLVDREDRM
jgi:hypothetical protein